MAKNVINDAAARTQVCPAGTTPLVMYPEDNTPPLNQAACVRRDVKEAKQPVQAELRRVLGQLGLQPGVDYYSYVRVVPKSVVDNPQQNCSCMCGCS